MPPDPTNIPHTHATSRSQVLPTPHIPLAFLPYNTPTHIPFAAAGFLVKLELYNGTGTDLGNLSAVEIDDVLNGE